MKKHSYYIILAVALMAFGTGCAKSAVSTKNGLPKLSSAYAKPSTTFTGRASWYGYPFHGRTTANGEKYNMYALTAAHKSLPFGSRVLVVNLKNNRSLMVRINDRGPYIAGRDLDLSYAAAKELDMVGTGVAPVWMAIYPPQAEKIVALAGWKKNGWISTSGAPDAVSSANGANYSFLK